MKSAVQLIVLLACTFLCTSGNPITKCRCIKLHETLRRPLIAKVDVYEPNPFCSKRQVIAIMTDDKERCLDPKSKFTQNLLRDLKIKTTTTTTTTTTTAATTKSAATSSSVTRQ